jgi:hypothetical protein
LGGEMAGLSAEMAGLGVEMAGSSGEMMHLNGGAVVNMADKMSEPDLGFGDKIIDISSILSMPYIHN